MTTVPTYPCGEPPATSHVREVAPGVLWLRMPMPFQLDHINLWALRDLAPDGSPGWALVDTGLQTPETMQAWDALLRPGGPLGGLPITRVLVTHMHPDHVGLAGWLARRHGCKLWMTREEYLNCRVLTADTGRQPPQDAIDFYSSAGWTDSNLDVYRQSFGGFGKMIGPLPDSYRRLRDGEELTIGENRWKVVVGTGHSPEHACFHCPELRVLISGDQVLPVISSNVSVYPTEPQADPLADWLHSIGKIRAAVPDDVLVLPSHNKPFLGLHCRLDYLAAGHARGLNRLRDTLREPSRAVDVFGALFARPVTGEDHQLLQLATGESLAHLNHLLGRGEAAVITPANGVKRYYLTSAADGQDSKEKTC
jgi:glyoxylase-like metal-dependent hydrolase (beta-lactamase superfamily II)